jgi:hypothetical protein
VGLDISDTGPKAKLAFTASGASPTETGDAAVQATSAAAFEDSVGVVAHIDSGVAVWEDTTLLL